MQNERQNATILQSLKTKGSNNDHQRRHIMLSAQFYLKYSCKKKKEGCHVGVKKQLPMYTKFEVGDTYYKNIMGT